jgi:hypothetical protein
MTTQSNFVPADALREEADLLRVLLADAHSRIRELQAQVADLSTALLRITLNDRRFATGSRSDGDREHRRALFSAPVPGTDRRGRESRRGFSFRG